ncbi:MAG: TonB-dependent receptor [Gemmatimonadetes bacterium]|nr:TonB-dependent receptor [Gemmatimonadota bacterium]
MHIRHTGAALVHVAALMLGAQSSGAQNSRPDSIRKLDAVKVVAAPDEKPRITPLQLNTLPATASVTSKKIDETINIIDTEDAVKYLPSVFLRKRNNGDTQAVMGTRTWGVSSSARSLIFADGIPLTALIANNNTIGGPRWGLVAPEQIERIDMMYGPFSAAYAGNSMGAVMEITTRMPDKLTGSINQTQAVQTFDLYGTSSTYGTSQTAATLGDRLGKFSFWGNVNYQNSHSQPLSYVTSATFPNGTTGGFAAQNKLNANANILGATGLLHTAMTNATAKVAYDITPVLRAAYSFSSWSNDADSFVDPFLSASGQSTYAGQAGFASGFYGMSESHSAHSLSLRSNSKSDWDFEAVATRYRFDEDRQRLPTTASSTGTTFGSAGRVAVLDGTGWGTYDLKGTWRAGGLAGANVVSLGAHYDQYSLKNPTYNTPDWNTGDVYSSVASEGDGKTRTAALWLQDAWRITPGLKLTVGGRYEDWRAFDGFNANGSTKVMQPAVSDTKFSPKASLAWTARPEWLVSTSVGKAYRFATAAELYQLVTTGTTFTAPNANLTPDNVLAAEVRVERRFEHGMAQVSLFQDDVHDAIISQFLPLVAGSATLYSVISNVDHVRSRGVELSLGGNDLFVQGLEMSGSVTYLDAKTLALTGQASATAAPGSSIGKRLPNIPDWRANFVTTYRPADRLALSLAGRYSGTVYTTLDNADVNPNTYQGFSAWFVADAHVNYRFTQNWSSSAGVDNLLDRKYFYFHPFPQRTFVGNVKFNF